MREERGLETGLTPAGSELSRPRPVSVGSEAGVEVAKNG